MTVLPIVGGLAVCLCLVLLLVSLNLFSLWRWYIKAGAIVVTIAGIAVLYFCMTGLIGWASPGQMPERFSLLSTRIVEPDKLRGLPGHIYLWVEEVDDRQIVIGPPRAFEVPYKVEVASEVASAQTQIDGGGKILGQFRATSSEEAARDASVEAEGEGEINTAGSPNTSTGGSGNGAETIGDPAALSFSEMPPVDLPDKGAIQVLN